MVDVRTYKRKYKEDERGLLRLGLRSEFNEVIKAQEKILDKEKTENANARRRGYKYKLKAYLESDEGNAEATAFYRKRPTAKEIDVFLKAIARPGYHFVLTPKYIMIIL